MVGTLSMYWGFRLFVKEKWGDTGEIEGSIKDFKFTFKRAAPGTFFSVFGAIIIVFTIIQGFYTYENTNMDQNSLNSDKNMYYEFQETIPLPDNPPN